MSSTNVEEWLQKVEKAMKISLSKQMQGCLKAISDMDRYDIISKFPSQTIFAVEQIIWTHNVFSAYKQ